MFSNKEWQNEKKKKVHVLQQFILVDISKRGINTNKKEKKIHQIKMRYDLPSETQVSGLLLRELIIIGKYNVNKI